jgi:hypothetical protein
MSIRRLYHHSSGQTGSQFAIIDGRAQQKDEIRVKVKSSQRGMVRGAEEGGGNEKQ